VQEMFKRASKIMDIVLSKDLDCILLVDISNVFYVSDFRGYEGIFALIPKEHDPLLFVPKLEYERAKEESKIHVEQYTNFSAALIESLRNMKCKKVGLCYKHTPHTIVNTIKTKLPNIELTDVSENIANVRMVKDTDELERIVEAIRIAEKGLEEALNTITDGISELNVAAKAEYSMRISGSEKTPFPTIVASGPNAALPHAVTSSKIVRKGEVVIVDLGATFKGYVSDLTRTISVGKVDGKVKDMFQAVLEAQKAAIRAIKAGIKASDVDKEARKTLEEYGYKEYFIHNTGHGIGVNVHELPIVGEKSKNILKQGMVITVEPGVYIKGYAGIRIEDDVLVTKTGCRVLSRFKKDLVD